MPFVFVIPGALREFSGGRAEVRIDAKGGTAGGAGTLREALDLLWRECPGARDRVLNERGEVRVHVNLFVDGENARYLGGLAAPVRAGAEIIILPAVSGG